jgi:hypothetical protein
VSPNTIALASFVMNALMLLGGMVWYFGNRNAGDAVTARDLERLEKTKADKSDLSAVEKRMDTIERLFDRAIADIKEEIRTGVAKVEAALALEHKRRSDEHVELQYVSSDVKERLVRLESTVFGQQGAPHPERRRDDVRRKEDQP